jgi:hypothetical protein
MEQSYYHFHALLVIVANGGQHVVPAGTGILDPVAENNYVTGGRCFYWLHAHANDGIIHIEAPQGLTFALGNYFDIWGETLSPGQVGPYSGHVTAYVNGRQFSGDPRAIRLGHCEEIQLNVDNMTPPQSYAFPSGLGC